MFQTAPKYFLQNLHLQQRKGDAAEDQSQKWHESPLGWWSSVRSKRQQTESQPSLDCTQRAGVNLNEHINI